ncbi:malate synthase G [Umboniibacter marinipuniceus]|uniref:Malate synthase G n=1 Tax=Umboniibacter marinipuniceus TaxID=569599 RepID=A0A3M0A2H5_9GAMM|nr:malate synthase G [Umboniibacter marinipuniceus]RMA78847.1 malate synthase [Umboniibacter marinipuniceus]
MTQYQSIGTLQVADVLADFINRDVLPGLAIESAAFWAGFEHIIEEFAPQNRELLIKRDDLQARISEYHRHHPKLEFQPYKTFLQEIGYLEPVVDDFTITTDHVDAELAEQAGPQLVVPIMNARYAINAANARWGSLYDALYGTDALISEPAGKGYDTVRGAKVIAWAKSWLDENFQLQSGSHQDAVSYRVESGELVIELLSGDLVRLRDSSAWKGFSGEPQKPERILLEHNRLSVELQFNADTNVGKADSANMSDILLESALSTIMDCEDSVAAVDAEDKVLCYKNWLGLMQGNLVEQVEKNGQTIERKLNEDRRYIGRDGETIVLKGRSLLFVRNVGHLMTNDAILDASGREVPEGIIDGVVTSLISLYDLNRGEEGNSRCGSIYIVKPKMHGSAEVAFADELFAAIENLYQLPSGTIKMGIMDEERRTSINLKNCIAAASSRVAFINTGFLDRTGDEIHTSMLAGAFLPKAEIKQAVWLGAYENSNVDIGLKCGLQGRAQIGKGMWPIPDQMAEMLKQKIGHPKAGANTAWVPSPTAATLHALHYHQLSVAAVQDELKSRAPAAVDDILQIPLQTDISELDEKTRLHELDNNVQGILGYVVRWVDLGVGCSKVPDINDVGLMEDRATLRISSQHICNWLTQSLITAEQVDASMIKMAAIVDQQNAGDPAYRPMATNPSENLAFAAARDLIFLGAEQPSGYTEPLLHAYRRKVKSLEGSCNH